MAITTLEEGFDYILSHLEGQRQLWPRTISTKTTDNQQVLVRNREEALARYAQANWIDCRLSAYPPISALSSFVSVNLDIPPSVIMIDLDRATFNSLKALDLALSRTLKMIERISSTKIQPTVIWSGNGYHIYLILNAFVLEEEDALNNDRFGSNPSQKFLRFAEYFLSNGKCDLQHNKTVSFLNCMLRVPCSINSKNGQTVKIIQNWNGYRPSIKLFLEDFYVYLCGQRIKELKVKNGPKIFVLSKGNNTIQWIERLLQTPISDFRKFTMWSVIAPYLISKKRFSYDESYSIMLGWLTECNKLRKLDFNRKQRVDAALKRAYHFFPISLEKLKTEHEKFYNMLNERGVLIW